MSPELTKLIILFDAIVGYVIKYGPILLRNGILLFSLGILHFSIYILQFDAHISVLIDAGAITRFFFGGLFLYSIVFSTLLILLHLTFGGEINPFKKIGEVFSSKEPIAIGFIIKNSSRLFTHAISICIFFVYYIGPSNIKYMFGLIAVYFSFYWLGHLLRDGFKVILRNTVRKPRDTKVSPVGLLIAAGLITSAMASGELRADYVKRNYTFLIGPAASVEKEKYSIFLSTATGVFLWSNTKKSVVFLPWDSAYVIISESGRRQTFGLKSLVFLSK